MKTGSAAETLARHDRTFVQARFFSVEAHDDNER
jgi:hypothetical protein